MVDLPANANKADAPRPNARSGAPAGAQVWWWGAAAILALLALQLAMAGRWDGVAGASLVFALGLMARAELARQATIAPRAAPPPAIGTPLPRLQDLSPLVDALPEAALLIDRDGRVIASNAEARRQLQFKAEGLRLSAVLRQPEVLDAVEAAALDGATRTVEYETASQFEEHFRVYVSPIVWAGARAALAIFNDRTAMINSERMRADFLANASHELKTPVASLSLLIETVSGPARGDVEAQDRFLPMMREEIDRMRRLIDDLLSLSKIELNEHVPPSGRAELAAIASEAIDALKPLAQARGVSVEAVSLAGDAPVAGDHFQLTQVAKNLIENAIKYTPSGGRVKVELGQAASREAAVEQAARRWDGAGQVALSTPPPRAAGAFAYLRVVDEGPGIARRHLPRLGERFYRLEREGHAERPGTGLGLAIVKHIVNRHSGGLLVESEPGRGSAFAVYFELAAARVGPAGATLADAGPANWS